MRQTALFVGRFQPLHKGHVNALKNLLKTYQKVVIAIGSTNRLDCKNPFSFRERKAMIDASLSGFGKRYIIIGVADTESDAEWVDEITRKAEFNDVVTGNTRTAKCFSGYEIVKPKMMNPGKYSATKIRKLILEDGNWKSLVPKEIIPAVDKYIAKQEFLKRQRLKPECQTHPSACFRVTT